MQQLHIEHTPDAFAHSPIECVEDVLTGFNWVFNRLSADEVMVKVTGKGCDYLMFFIWQDDINALQFCCQYDLTIPQINEESALKTLRDLNEKMWVGHFDMPANSTTPSYRYSLLCDSENTPPEQIAQMINIAITQCESSYPAFKVLSTDMNPDSKSLSLALMETCGES